MAQNNPQGGEGRPRAKAWAAGIDGARQRAAIALPASATAAANQLGRSLAQWIDAELSPGRLTPWLPIAFGLGIVIYFTALREPASWAARISCLL